MTFQDAVKELSEGRCTKIKRSTYNGYVYLDEDKLKHNFDSAVLTCIEDIIADDWQLVDPIPQTEEVEVVRWMVVNEDGNSLHAGINFSSYDNAKKYCINVGVNIDQIVKMKGPYTRKKKRQVKHREKIGLQTFAADFLRNRKISHGRAFVEWETEI